MKPAIFTTEEPPAPIDDMLVKEYVNGLRRHIEILNIQIETLANELQSTRDLVHELTERQG
jgi:ribosome-binding protein aMBF1 (putative translation factor)